MDWKSFYKDELSSPEGCAHAARCFADVYDDPEVDAALRGGAVLSFPHTSIFYAGVPLARVISGLYRNGFERVIALGVLHGGTLPEDARRRYQECVALIDGPHSHPVRAAELFATFQGGFVSSRPAVTPFGELELARPDSIDEDAGDVPVLRENPGLLVNEFSLDNFLALVVLRARELERAPLAVLPVFIGLTRGPGADFAVARRLGRWLAAAAGPRTAVVTTGDLVHYGHAYSAAREMEGRPTDPAQLTRHFRAQVEEALAAALHNRDYETFHRASSNALKSDQRHILPVVAEYLGSGARHRILSFCLSDYAWILGVAPPCVVASTLAVYAPSESPGGERDFAEASAGAGARGV